MMMMVILAMHVDKGESSAAEEYGEEDDDDGDDNDSCSSLVYAISQLALFLRLSLPLPLFLSLETFIHSVIHACPREQVFEGNWMKSGSTPPQTGKK